MHITNRFLLVAVVALLVSTVALGQAQTTGRISGRVIDEEGNAVAGARVTLISPALQGERVTETDAEGRFLAALLPVGPYGVTFASPGKQSAQVSLRVAVGRTDRLEVTLQSGEEQTERVTVYASATPLETTVVGENFNYNTTVEELPIPFRNVNNVARYAPNIQETAWAPFSLMGVSSGMVISGAPAYENVVQLDGAEISMDWGLGLDLYLEDAIEEIQVMTSGISARYGRFQGGVVNTITKGGGNEFDGTFRAEFSKESWNSRTPFGEEQSDDLNQAYQATLGGYVLKDKLWFFVGGRTVPTESTSGQTFLTQEVFQHEIDEDRWQVKLRGAPAPNHVLEASYLQRERADKWAGTGRAGDLGGATSGGTEDFSLFTFDWQSVFGSRSFLEFKAWHRDGSTFWGGDPQLGSPFYDAWNRLFYNNARSDRTEEWTRDSDSASLAYTHVFGDTGHGSHTLEAGAQWVRRTDQGNGRQSATGYFLEVWPAGATPFAVLDPATGEIRFNLDPSEIDVFRWFDLPLDPLTHDVNNYAVYVQDSWQLKKWRIDAGLRWERYTLSSERPDLDPDPEAIVPRLGVTRTISKLFQLQGTYARYAAPLREQLMQWLTFVLGQPSDLRPYVGTPRLGLDRDEVEAVLRDDSQWGNPWILWDPSQPTEFLATDYDLPQAEEFTLGLRGAFPPSSGSFTLTYIHRDYGELLEDFVGESGYVDRTDPLTGDPLLDDKRVFDNSSQAERRYRALAATWDYRPGARWGIGGNWTYSEMKGNFEHSNDGRLVWAGPIGDYVRSRPEAAAVPVGYLLDDTPHRIQAWGNYRFDLKRAGSLVLGGLGRFQSGANWSRYARVPRDDVPEYVSAGPFYRHYFDGRGNNRFDDWWTLDLSARWQFTIFKQLNAWLKATVVNVFDNDGLIAYDTTGFASDDGMGNLSWEPSGNCGPGDSPSVDCTGFGRIRSQEDYQQPRGYWFTLGLSF
jgi:hypothetical protein